MPVGHPQRAQQKNAESKNISCIQCEKRFSTGKEVEHHMKEHTAEADGQKFENPSVEKACRYFKSGFCRKGDECVFKHTEVQENFTPKCNRGPGCHYFQQNRCHFLHPGVGFQQRECRYKDQCWNMFECPFLHPNQGFRFAHRRPRPPQGMRVNAWMDY